MIDLQLVLIGLAVGIVITMPLGPVGVIAIDRVLRHGAGAGMATGFGSALADGLFAAAAVFMVKAAGAFLADHLAVLQPLGGLVLIAFGLVLLRNHGPAALPSREGNSAAQAASAFAMTVSNPAGFLAVLALLSVAHEVLTDEVSLVRGLVVVLAVIAGAMAWWTGLVLCVARYRHHIPVAFQARAGLVCGTLVLMFGLVILMRATMPDALALIAG